MHVTPSVTAAQRVGEAIQAQMRAVGMSQVYLCSVIGMKQPTLSRKLSGEKQFLLDELFRIAAALGVSASTFTDAAA